MGIIIRHLSATVNVADKPKPAFPSLIRHPPIRLPKGGSLAEVRTTSEDIESLQPSLHFETSAQAQSKRAPVFSITARREIIRQKIPARF